MNRNHESCLLFFGGNYSTRIIVGSQKKLPIFSSKVIPRPLGSGSPNKNARNSTMMREECLYMWKKQYVCICIYIYMRNIIYIYIYIRVLYIYNIYTNTYTSIPSDDDMAMIGMTFGMCMGARSLIDLANVDSRKTKV